MYVILALLFEKGCVASFPFLLLIYTLVTCLYKCVRSTPMISGKRKAARKSPQNECLDGDKFRRDRVHHFTTLLLDSRNDPVSRDSKMTRAVEQGMNLLESGSTVPFICRYRSDLVKPLSVEQVHELASLQAKHSSLKSVRDRYLNAIVENKFASTKTHKDILRRASISVSKTYLEELYAPFKAPTKGSLSERAQHNFPRISTLIDRLWEDFSDKNISSTLLGVIRRTNIKDECSARQAAVHILASKISSSALIADALRSICGLGIELKVSDTEKKPCSSNKFELYVGKTYLLHKLQDYQILALRRGYELDKVKLTKRIRNKDIARRRIMRIVFDDICGSKNILQPLKKLIQEAVEDSFTRLLARRLISLAWRERLKVAERRAIKVFADNVSDALLAPPHCDSKFCVAVDPGHRAGMKVAVLDPCGNLANFSDSMCTLKYLQELRSSENMFTIILNFVRSKNIRPSDKVIIALGNGEGSGQCRYFIENTASKSQISCDIVLVDEAGASVWSVTDSARKEFPGKHPSSIAAVSIGRRFQNPLFELVKIPPSSLGLGQYQHDLSVKRLAEKLRLATVDAVAFVGVDINICSLEVLQNVPGLTQKLAERIIKARPFANRCDLLRVKGIGPKTFENCVGFIRVNDSNEPLDKTRVHPESYHVAKWIFKNCACKDLNDLKSVSNGIKKESLCEEGSKLFQISEANVSNILDYMLEAAVGVDPRIIQAQKRLTSNDVSSRPINKEFISNLPRLEESCPVLNVSGVVTNVTDFGAFVDFGVGKDGLLHNSNMGEEGWVRVGQKVGVDIVHVDAAKKLIKLARSQGNDLENDFNHSPNCYRKRKRQ